MKSIVITAMICLVSLSLRAQKLIEKTLPWTSGQALKMDINFADSIHLKGWDDPRVYIKVTVNVNGGLLNDVLLVDFNSRPGEITVKATFDEQLLKQARPEDCSPRHGDHLCSEIFYEVYLPRQAGLWIETVDGNIKIKGLSGPLFAKSVSGFVDVSWPQNKGADITMQSIDGKLYWDPDLVLPVRDNKTAAAGRSLKGHIKGGGSPVRLESISNNVSLRPFAPE